MRNQLPPSQIFGKILIVQIDNLRAVLKVLREIGYTAERQRTKEGKRLAIWNISKPWCRMFEVYVDTTRTLDKDAMYIMDRPEIKWEPPKVKWDYPNLDYGTYLRYVYGIGRMK